MTKLVDRLPLLPRADGASEPGHPEVLRGVRSAAPFFPLTSDLRPPTSQRSALTLIEMLVALAVTLVMMAAVVNLFANMSASIRNRRAAIETGSQLRQTRNRLAMDLSGATCRGSTWQDPAENQGYIEIIEGDFSDVRPTADAGNDGTFDLIDPATSLVPGSQAVDVDAGEMTDGRALGDWDDVLALTTQNEGAPFTGKVPFFNSTSGNWEARFEESHQAEVVWFAEQNGAGGAGEPGMRRIYRRALLIRPDLELPPGTNLTAFYDKYDVSVRIEGGRLVANTLGDLTKREHRFARRTAPPFTVDPGLLRASAETMALNSVLAFDVRIFDPGAPLIESAGVTLEPSDFGWAPALAAGDPIVGYGAYCDLGWGWDYVASSLLYPTAAPPAGVPLPVFNIPRPAGHHPFSNSLSAPPAVYDTWSYHYENDGINQDSAASENWRNLVFDQGANGLDDDNANGVDDRGERETAPPYDVPLRGVKVILRVYEPDSRQIRESSVTHSFKQ